MLAGADLPRLWLSSLGLKSRDMSEGWTSEIKLRNVSKEFQQRVSKSLFRHFFEDLFEENFGTCSNFEKNSYSKYTQSTVHVFREIVFHETSMFGHETFTYMHETSVSGHVRKNVRFFSKFFRVSRAPNSYAGSPALRNQWSAETLMSAIKAMDGDAQLDVLQNLADILPDSPSQLENMMQAWYHNYANMYLNFELVL